MYSFMVLQVRDTNLRERVEGLSIYEHLRGTLEPNQRQLVK